MRQTLTTDVLVVGGGTGGTAAAIQSVRRGVQTILVSEFPWLGGMLTAAGVPVPDGNELAAFQTGIWGAFLRELQQRQLEGLDHAWVSFFSYDPQVGAQIFADWVNETNLQWISDQLPLAVLKQGECVTGVEFEDYTIQAKITLDGTELGDLLALAEIPHRWGWDQAQGQEPSAPKPGLLTQQYPVQAPTWVVILQDYGGGEQADRIPAVAGENLGQFAPAWEGYKPEEFLNYGRLPGNRLMLNWPQCGNDYGQGLERLVASTQAKKKFCQEAKAHSQSFARFIQIELGQRYGLAKVFPSLPGCLGGGAFALHPYYRESRRLQGQVTVTELDILPQGATAPLPVNPAGEIEAIAIGNYANDHHYPGWDFPLQPKSLRWGGRWTGTPFTIPYRALVPAQTDGFLACEKNISVSHIANGATRLQPVVLGIGQAAGMAAALCIQRRCQPRALPVRVLQQALLQELTAPAAVVPLFNLVASHPEWLYWQQYYLDHPEYPLDGNSPVASLLPQTELGQSDQQAFTGTFYRQGDQDYRLRVALPTAEIQTWLLVTLYPWVNEQLKTLKDEQTIDVKGWPNFSGGWLRVAEISQDY